MVKLISSFLIILSLTGCGEGEPPVTTPEEPPVVTNPTITLEYVDNSTYWCIPQLFNGVPKYCAYGTYTHKHIPLAYEHNGDVYHVYTDNTRDDNFYIYVAKNNEERVLIHTIKDWNDPHTNAVIHVLNDGIVHVHVASRGIDKGFQKGLILESTAPGELNFNVIDETSEGYPQVWNTAWGEHVQYSRNAYDYDIHPKQWMREPWYRVGDKRYQIAKGGHYFISLYDDNTETLYVVYNWLIAGHPDSRVNLYAVKTKDGVNWTTINNSPVTLPLDENDSDALIYGSVGFTYLKDLKINDGLHVLFTEASVADPTLGSRYLKEWRNGDIRTLEKTNHNYSGGAYVGEYILSTNADTNMTGGDIVLYQDYKEVFRDNSLNCAYVRKVINSDTNAVISCDDFNGNAGHYLLKID